jgi:hypothetical protein
MQRRALMIADNRISDNAGWDDDMLTAELAALRDEDVDLGLLGFDEVELDHLLEGSTQDSEDTDAAPAPPSDPVSRPGDLWICGQHQVLCGDATVLTDVEAALGGELADFCFTDPPYNVNYANGSDKKASGKRRPILNDALGTELESGSTAPASIF